MDDVGIKCFFISALNDRCVVCHGQYFIKLPRLTVCLNSLLCVTSGAICDVIVEIHWKRMEVLQSVEFQCEGARTLLLSF